MYSTRCKMNHFCFWYCFWPAFLAWQKSNLIRAVWKKSVFMTVNPNMNPTKGIIYWIHICKTSIIFIVICPQLLTYSFRLRPTWVAMVSSSPRQHFFSLKCCMWLWVVVVFGGVDLWKQSCWKKTYTYFSNRTHEMVEIESLSICQRIAPLFFSFWWWATRKKTNNTVDCQLQSRGRGSGRWHSDGRFAYVYPHDLKKTDT